MKQRPVLPPAPLNASCPLWLLPEWAEIFQNARLPRTTVLLEVGANCEQTDIGVRWLALVTWRLKGPHLATRLNAALRRDYTVPPAAAPSSTSMSLGGLGVDSPSAG